MDSVARDSCLVAWVKLSAIATNHDSLNCHSREALDYLFFAYEFQQEFATNIYRHTKP
jgi:hypothetical protein